MSNIIEQVCRTACLPDDGRQSDGELLERFLSLHEEAAFAVLVRRHGPMVLGVCRRVLQHADDAEDAFQATFLVLVRKAATLLPRAAVGNWLYGVAYHTAQKALAASLKRRAKEAQVRDMPRAEATESWQDWQPLLDRELSRLSDKYREPVVLCELQGKTLREAAQQLGIPEGTLSGRLTTARRRLAQRLSRHGVTLSAGALTTMLAPTLASAYVPAPLFASTIQAAALLAAGETMAGVVSVQAVGLSEGVLRAMWISKLKVVAALLLGVGLMAAGAGVLAHHVLTDGPADRAVADAADIADAVVFFEADDPAARDANRPAPGASVAGTLQAVDADKSSVTIGVFTRKDGNSQKTYAVAKDAKIVQFHKEAKLADLKKGSKATLKLTTDEKTVVSITVASPSISAPLKAVEAEKSITVTVESRQGKQDKTYAIGKDVKVTMDGKEAKLADLKAGTVLTLLLDEGDAVVEVRTQSRGRPRNE